MSDSIFTKIINRQEPAEIYYEDEQVIAFKNKYPNAPVHALIVPKHPYASLEEISLDNVELMGKLLQVCRQVAAQLGIQDNYKLHMNVGNNVQMIHHLHIHLLGGWDKPSVETTVGM